VVAGHAGRTQDVPMATTSRRDPNIGQIQQQATGATTEHHKLSRTEMNVLKTMIAVIFAFVVCWTPGASLQIAIFVAVCTF